MFFLFLCQKLTAFEVYEQFSAIRRAEILPQGMEAPELGESQPDKSLQGPSKGLCSVPNKGTVYLPYLSGHLMVNMSIQKASLTTIATL